MVPLKDIKKYNDDEVVILETGRSGEPLKSLQKMALGRHRAVNIHEGDLVFITTTPSHAVETTVAKTRDMIYRAGGTVKAISDEFNSSGHASKNDLELMMNLLEPEYVFPVQGEYRLMSANADCASAIGIDDDHIFLLNKGDVAEFENDKMIVASSVESGNTMIDGSGIGDIGNIVLRDRKILSEDGIFIAVVTIDRKKNKIVDVPKIATRGFVYVKTSRDLMAESSDLVANVVQQNLDNKEYDWSHLKQDVRDQLNHFLYEQTKRHPVILPVIMEINARRGGSQGKKKKANSKSEKKQTKAARTEKKNKKKSSK